MSLRADTERLARKTEADLLRLYGRRNQLTEEQFVRLAATILAAARVQGVMLADLSLSGELRRALGGRYPLLGLTAPESDYQRLQDSVKTVLTQEMSTVEGKAEREASISKRLARLGRDSPAEAIAWAMSKAMQRRGVPGWTRQTDSNPCQMCRNLADGVVRSPEVSMLRHTGCMCVQQPVIT